MNDFLKEYVGKSADAVHENAEQAKYRHILGMWAMEGSGGYNELGIVCPYCEKTSDSSYVHLHRVVTYRDIGELYEDATPRINQAIKDLNLEYKRYHEKLSVSGAITVLPFECEEGHHKWELLLGEHKGSILCNIILTDDGLPHYEFDSPIEQAFWEAYHRHFIDETLELTPQHPIGKYRVDFAHIPTKTAIELDGFATHSSTEDIASDRKRQRAIEAEGWHVIRFGGKEIHDNVHTCTMETIKWIVMKLNEVSA